MLRLYLSTAMAGWSPAYAAALALVAIQVGIGIIYKIAQKGGRCDLRDIQIETCSRVPSLTSV